MKDKWTDSTRNTATDDRSHVYTHFLFSALAVVWNNEVSSCEIRALCCLVATTWLSIMKNTISLVQKETSGHSWKHDRDFTSWKKLKYIAFGVWCSNHWKRAVCLENSTQVCFQKTYGGENKQDEVFTVLSILKKRFKYYDQELTVLQTAIRWVKYHLYHAQRTFNIA